MSQNQMGGREEKSDRMSPMLNPNEDDDDIVMDTQPPSKPSYGRPPLLPRDAQGKGDVSPPSRRRTVSEDVAQFHQPINGHHIRGASSGDYSCVSAVTDPGEYHNAGNRKLPKAAPRTSDASELLQPILSPKSAYSQSPTQSYSKRRLTLADLKTANPLETEAEAAILHAIEKKRSEDNVAAAMLPDAPDELVNMIQPPSRPSIHDFSGSMPPPTPARHRWIAAAKHLRSQRIISASETPEAGHRTAERWIAVTKHLNSQKIISTSETPEAEHRITEESELDLHEKLYALAGQMLEVQVEAEKEEGQEGKAAGNNGDHNEPTTQMDNLVQNANTLFRRSTVSELNPISEAETDDQSHKSRKEDKKGFLAFLRRGAKHPKKKDVRVSDDIETGVGTGGGGGGGAGGNGSPHKSKWKKTTSPMSATGKSVARKARSAAVGDLKHLRDFLRPRKLNIYRYCRSVLQWMFLPTLILSFALYYAGNPTTCSDGCASFSWLFIFLFIRQVITFSLAKVLELFIIDFLSLRNRLTVRVLGSTLTLLIVQSKGWPFILLMWSLLDFATLYGTGEFANHWLFYQDAIPVFNAKNPSGNVLTDHWYSSILIGCVIVSCAYAVKRLWLGVHLGQRTYRQYGKQLAAVMNDMLLISLLAGIAHDLMESDENGKTDATSRPETIFKWDDMKSQSLEEEEDSLSAQKTNTEASCGPENRDLGSPPQTDSKQNMSPSIDQTKNGVPNIGKPLYQSSLQRSQKIRIAQLLGAWDEPPREAADELGDMSLGAMLQFKQALSYMNDDYPFSTFFGPAKTRELCVESSQKLYETLLRKTPGEFDLPFETIALAAVDKRGDINANRLKRLYRLFHPDPEGYLCMLDFVRSVDKVYKDLRLLRAAISNSSQIDRAFEQIFNFFFAIVLAFIVLPIAGYNPLTLIVSLSGLIVGFAFMIGPASSKFFEGILFILVRRPYQIGDRINISSPRVDTGRDGSPGWFVEKVDLYSTTVRYATTNEVATYSNGSLAAERVINAARSPKANVFINLKFGVEVEFSKIEVFRTTVETFVKARTREWLALNAFRATRVEADLGFIEYVLVLQHVCSWQEVGMILTSKAELASYCLEVSKQLDMHYQAPPLPVNLAIAKPKEADLFQGEGFAASDLAPVASQSGTVPIGAKDD